VRIGFGLKRLVKERSPSDMIDKTLARMIDETLRQSGEIVWYPAAQSA
jgi:hypothetical protein